LSFDPPSANVLFCPNDGPCHTVQLQRSPLHDDRLTFVWCTVNAATYEELITLKWKIGST